MAKKSDNTVVNILRSEVTFWLTIISLVVGVVLAFSRVDARVMANEKQIRSNQQILEQIDKKVDDMLIKQTEIQKDINYIIERDNH